MEEGSSEFVEFVQNMALAHGSTVVEIIFCENCGKKSLLCHNWSERVPCQHCNTMAASKVPRRTAPGEVTLHHVVTALETLTSVYSVSPLNRFSSETEWAALPAEVRLAITQNMSAACVAVLKQVDSLAVALATKAE